MLNSIEMDCWRSGHKKQEETCSALNAWRWNMTWWKVSEPFQRSTLRWFEQIKKEPNLKTNRKNKGMSGEEGKDWECRACMELVQRERHEKFKE